MVYITLVNSQSFYYIHVKELINNYISIIPAITETKPIFLKY